MSERDERELAPPDYVEHIRSRLRIDDMPPERFVALYAHRWMLAGPLVYRYPDPEVDARVRRVYELLTDYEGLDDLRRHFSRRRTRACAAGRGSSYERPELRVLAPCVRPH
jgi:hypothetical protein